MNLLIISHTRHHQRGETVVGWGPTVREVDQLARLFDRVTHLAPLHDGPAPESAIPYEAANVCLQPVSPAGGSRWRAKLDIVAQYPRYALAIWRELRRADVVHVRCPSNISLLAVLLLAVRRSPRSRWIKYAGNWQPETGDPVSYAMQRRLLGWPRLRAQVTVNGHWPGQPAHVRSFFNPSLTRDELGGASARAADKRLSRPVRLLYVGRVEAEKGAGRAVEIAARLHAQGLPFHLDIIGDGPRREALERAAEDRGLAPVIAFHGWMARADINAYYERAHFIVLPAKSSEGWPKVLSEAMAYGVVPLASTVSSIPQYLQQFKTGRCFEADDLDGFAEAVGWYLQHPDQWKADSCSGLEAAPLFSYDHYLQAVRDLLELP